MTDMLAHALNLLIATLFFLPFYMKLKNIENFKVEIYAYDVVTVNLLPWATYVVLIIEFFLFFTFTTGLAEGWKQLLGIGLLSLFTWFTWKKTKKTGKESCFCYGEIGFLNQFPTYRNLILIGILLIDLFIIETPNNVYTMIFSLVFVMALSFSIEITHLLKKRVGPNNG